MFETCRRQEELNYNINLKKNALCWLTLRKGGDLLSENKALYPEDTSLNTGCIIVHPNEIGFNTY